MSEHPDDVTAKFCEKFNPKTLAIKYLRSKYPKATGLNFRLFPVEIFEKEDIIRMLMLVEEKRLQQLKEANASRDEWAKTAFEGAKR